MLKKNAIIQDIKNNDEQLKKLVEENSRLKQNRSSQEPPNRFDKQRKELVKELESSLSLGSSDQIISPLLKQIEALNLQTPKMGTCHEEELVSPSTVSFLVKGSHFKSRVPLISQELGGSITHFAKKILEYTPKLTIDQHKHIETITNRYARELEHLKIEKKNK